MNHISKKVLIYTGIGLGGIFVGSKIQRYREDGEGSNGIFQPYFPLSEKNRSLEKEYFESVLKRFYKNDNIKVSHIQSGDRSSLKDTFMSEVNKYRLFGIRQDEFQIDVIAKLLRSKDNRELFKSDIAVKNEEIAYNQILPLLNVYKDSTLPVPVCFSAKDETIITEDLCEAEGYKTFDKKTGFIEPNECVHILQALAKFHAATIVLKHKNNDAFKKVKNLTKEFLYSDPDSHLLEHQQNCLKNIISIYRDRFPSKENQTRIAALEHLLRVAKHDIKGLLSEEQKNNVFCHGDLLLTNILYKPHEKKTKDGVIVEMDIKFVDFQRVLYASIASDLVYLLFNNLMPDDYMKSKDYFLQKYLWSLKKNVEDCGVTVDPKLDLDWLKTEVDRFTEYGIISALWVLPLFSDNDPQGGREVTRKVLDENANKKFINERMEKWVDFYSKIFEKKYQK